MITVDEIHSAPSDELSSLKGRIESAYSSGEVTANNAQNHLWREFNKRCYLSDNQNLMLVPTDAGFRPINLETDRIILIDETGDIQLMDESGFLIPLTYSNPVATFGNNSYSFSSSTLDQFSFANIPELANATEFTLTCWMKKFGVGAGDRFMLGSIVSLSNYVSLIWNGTGITASVTTSGGDVSTSGTQNSSGWVHCAMVYDGSQSPDGLKLYIDGELDSSANVGPTSLDSDTFSNFNIGEIGHNSLFGSDGQACDVRLFSKALSSTEIQSVYNFENVNSGLIGRWISDNNDTLDYSSNHKSAIKNNNPRFVNGGPLNELPPFGRNSIELAGTDPSPFVGSQDKILNGTETELTLAFWIKRTHTGRYSIFAVREGTNNQTFLTWDFRDFIIWGARDGNPYFYSDLSANTSTDWNHLAISIDTTRSLSDRARCFLNGQFVSTASANDTISDGYLMLGLNHSSVPSSTDGEGRYSDCRVYNRALSDAEIEDIYDGELIENGLIHWIATDDQDIEDKISGITMISNGENFIAGDGPFV